MEKSSKVDAPTVSSYEMSHYQYLSTLWWKTTTPLNGLHVMNKLRIPWVVDKLVETNRISKETAKSPKPLQGLTILDIGCGGGFATEALAELGCTVVGIDPSPELIDVAERHLLQNPSLKDNITYIHGCLEEHYENNLEKYDAVFASEVVDHVDEKELFLELCVKCLKPEGSIFITAFNKTWLAWLVVILLFENVTGNIPPGTHLYERLIYHEDVKKILKKYNCQTRSIGGMLLNSFNLKWYWVPFKSLTFALHAVKDKK